MASLSFRFADRAAAPGKPVNSGAAKAGPACMESGSGIAWSSADSASGKAWPAPAEPASGKAWPASTAELFSRMLFSNDRNALKPCPSSPACAWLEGSNAIGPASSEEGRKDDTPAGSCTSMLLTFTLHGNAPGLPSRHAPSQPLTALTALQNWHSSCSGTILSRHTCSITNSSPATT